MGRPAIRKVNGKPVYWIDDNGMTHAAEGDFLTPQDFCLWTVCGSADVPANKGFHPGTGDEITCPKCLAIGGNYIVDIGNKSPYRADSWIPWPSFVCERTEMRVPDDIRRNVAYVGVDTPSGFMPYGTGFFVGVALDQFNFTFLVTAHHVVDQIRADSISVRLNLTSGRAVSIAIPKAHAVYHSDRATDIAVFPLSAGPDFDFKMVRMSRPEIADQRRDTDGIGVGDDVVAVGLYTSHHGLLKNIPVVRSGTIAAMPDEPVCGHRGYLQAYLVELRTIAGLSGSPVYLNPPPVTVQNGNFLYRKGFPYSLIGVLIGYHVTESATDQITVPRLQQEPTTEAARDYSPDERNTGFGIVVPVERVMDVLEYEEVKNNMNAAIRRLNENNPARPA